jgi:predicted nucleic acid-binding protein
LIFLDTNVVSETLRKAPDEAVIARLVRHDAELALPMVTIAEIAFGIEKIRPDQRAERLEQGLSDWRRPLRGPHLWTDGRSRARLRGNNGNSHAPGACNVGAGWDDRSDRA